MGGPGDGVLKRSHGVVLTGTVALPPTPRRSAHTHEFPVGVGVHRHVEAVERAGQPGTDRRPARRVRVRVVRGPEEHADPGDLDTDPAKADLLRAVLKRFTMTLPRIPMPWGMSPSSVTSAGSDILIEGRSAHRDLSLNGF